MASDADVCALPDLDTTGVQYFFLRQGERMFERGVDGGWVQGGVRVCARAVCG